MKSFMSMRRGKLPPKNALLPIPGVIGTEAGE